MSSDYKVLLRAFAERHVMSLVWALALAMVAGPTWAGGWLLLCLVASVPDVWLRVRAHGDAVSSSENVTSPTWLAASLLTNAGGACAAWIAWCASHSMGPAVAIVLLSSATLMVASQWRNSPRAALVMMGPYLAAAGAMCIQGAMVGYGFVPVMAFGLLVASAVAFFSLNGHAYRELGDANARNERLLRQIRLALDGAKAEVWEIDYGNRCVHGAERISKLVGTEVNFDSVTAGERLHDDERDTMMETAAREPGLHPVKLEHRVASAAGELWVSTDGLMEIGPDGMPVRSTFITTDISERKSLEKEVLEATNRAAEALSAKRVMLHALTDRLGSAPAAETETAAHKGYGEGHPSLRLLLTDLSEIVAEITRRDAMLAEAVGEIDAAREHAEKANAAKSQFLANTTHELRTPLNAIIGYGEILEEDFQARGDSSGAADVARILGAARTLLHLITDVLDLSKIEAGGEELCLDYADLAEVAREALDLTKPAMQKNGNLLETSGFESLGGGFVDAQKLKQCLLNLLSNAAKFTQAGRIEVGAARTHDNGADYAVFAVRDTGIGMTPEQTQRIFEPFAQAGASVSREFGGTGLGLSITRRLAHLLGGDVAVESAAGVGSTFTLRIKLQGAEELRAAG